MSKALDAKQAGYVERERKRKARRDEEEGEEDEGESSRPRPTKRARKDDDEGAEAPAAAGGSGLPSNIKRTFKQTQPLQDKLMLQAAKLKKERAAAGGSGE